MVGSRHHRPFGFSGGKINFGEIVAAAAEQELFEETAVHGQACHVVTTVDAFIFDDAGKPNTQFILVTVLLGN